MPKKTFVGPFGPTIEPGASGFSAPVRRGLVCSPEGMSREKQAVEGQSPTRDPQHPAAAERILCHWMHIFVPSHVSLLASVMEVLIHSWFVNTPRFSNQVSHHLPKPHHVAIHQGHSLHREVIFEPTRTFMRRRKHPILNRPSPGRRQAVVRKDEKTLRSLLPVP